MNSSTDPLPDLTGPAKRIAVIGGGPAGLMAAERLCDAGYAVDLYEQMGSVGRKFLLAGKGGLNLTHGEAKAQFIARYRERSEEIGRWLGHFDATDLRRWASQQGVDTFVGSSGRVFPQDLRAAPLLRGWVRRLRASGVRFHVHHKLTAWARSPAGDFKLQFESRGVAIEQSAHCLILALGGGSWPQLGSDGYWTRWIGAKGIGVAPLKACNCGFEIDWSVHFSGRFAGAAIKPVEMCWTDSNQQLRRQRGEFICTAVGVEGSLFYAASPDLREQIAASACATVQLDLLPDHSERQVLDVLEKPRAGRSLGEVLRRSLRLEGARAGLVFEFTSAAERRNPSLLAKRIKSLSLPLRRCRPLAEAISSAGGVEFDSLDPQLMSRSCPGVFFAGEMLDWEAPTGGYLLTACFASAVVAATAAILWLRD